MSGHQRWRRWTALGIGGLGAAFWLWFGIASAAGEQLGVGNWLAHLIVPGGLLVAVLLIARRWEAVGGALLALVGAVLLAGYPLLMCGRFPPATVITVAAALGLPPLLSGGLLLIDWRIRRRAA